MAQSRAGTDEETGTDGATDGDHVKMTLLEGFVELVGLVDGGATLERLGRATHASPETEPLGGRIDGVAVGRSIVASGSDGPGLLLHEIGLGCHRRNGRER